MNRFDPHKLNPEIAHETRESLTLVKGPERYLFIYEDNDTSRRELLCMFGRMATNPDIAFSWYDAAILSQRVREQMTK